MKKERIKVIVFLHIVLMIYSLLGICSKLAAGVPFLSKQFLLYYGVVILNLFLYAIIWQQIIKRMPLIVAYANKAVTVFWGIVWGFLFFDEAITVNKIVGAIIIIFGIILIVTEQEKDND